jgi:hypothetical protein
MRNFVGGALWPLPTRMGSSAMRLRAIEILFVLEGRIGILLEKTSLLQAWPSRPYSRPERAERKRNVLNS